MAEFINPATGKWELYDEVTNPDGTIKFVPRSKEPLRVEISKPSAVAAESAPSLVEDLPAPQTRPLVEDLPESVASTQQNIVEDLPDTPKQEAAPAPTTEPGLLSKIIGTPAGFMEGVKRIATGVHGAVNFPATVIGQAGLGLEQLGVPGAGALARAAENNEAYVRKTLGTPDTGTVSEKLLEFGGQAAIPTGSIAKIISSGPGIMKKLGQAADMIIPGTAVATKANLAANTLVPTAIAEGFEQFTGRNDPVVSPAKAATPAATPDYDMEPYRPPVTPIDQVPEDNTLKYALTAGAAVAASVLLRRALRPEQPRAPSDLSYGQPNIPPTGNSWGTKLQAAVQDSFASIVNPIKKIDPIAGELLAERISVSRHGPMAKRIQHMFETGELPRQTSANARSPSSLPFAPKEWFDAVGAMEPGRREILEKALLARDEIQQRAINAEKWVNNPNNQGKTLDKIKTSKFHDEDTEELARKVAEAEQDPLIRRLMSDYSRLTQGMITYAESRGLITPENAAKMRREHSNYVPNYEMPVDQGLWTRMWNKFIDTGQSGKVGTELDNLLERGAEGVSNPMPASQALARYLHELPTFAEQNEVRRLAISILRRDPQYSKIIKPINGKASADTVTYRENGVAKHVDVKDPQMKYALEYTPYFAPYFLDAPRRMFQRGTTGVLAPLRAPVSLTMDAMAAMFSADKSLKFGYLPGVRTAVGFDPTALAASVAGAARGVGATALREAGFAVSTLVNTDAKLVHLMGKENVQKLADYMADQYARTHMSMFERYGGVSGKYSTNLDMPATSDVLRTVSPMYNGSGMNMAWQQFARFYDGVLGSVHNGARLNILAQNYRKGMSESEVIELMHKIHEAGPNFSKHGSSKVVNTLESAIPYMGTTIQATAKFAQMAREHPWLVTSSFVTGSLIPAVVMQQRAAQLGPEYNEHYWSQPAWWRATTLPWYVPGRPPEEYINIPNPVPEFQPFTAISMQALDAMYDLRNGGQLGDKSITDALKDALHMPDERRMFEMSKDVMAGVSRAIGPATPPALSLVTMPFGQKWDLDPFDPGSFGLHKLGGNRMEGADADKYRVLGTSVPVVAEEMLRTLFGTFADTAVQGIIAGDLALKDTKDINFAAKRAGQEYIDRAEQRTAFLPGIVHPVYKNNNTAEFVQEKRDAIRQLGLEKAAGDDRDRGFNTTGRQVEVSQDPAIRSALQKVGQLTNTKFSQMQREYDRIDRELVSIRSNSTNESLESRTTRLNALYKKRQSVDERYLKMVDTLEDALSTNMGRKITVQQLHQMVAAR